MPVGFSSAARNLFLLGSSGADAVTNFFKAIDKSSNPNEGYYTPSQIKYNYSDGKFLLSGTGLGNDSFGWVEKRDYDGSNSTSTEEWGVRISPAVYSSALTLTTMELDGNDNVIIVGKYGGVNGDYGLEAPYIAKYSNAGVLDWQSTSSTGDLEYTGVTSDSSGNYYACGNTPDIQISATGSDVAIAYVEKFDSNGNPGWGKAASMPNRDAVLTKIASNNKGAVIAVGYLEDDSAKKGYIVKIDSSTGEVLWDRTIKSPYDPDGLNSYQDVECKDIFIDSSGQIYIVGNKFNHGFIIKYTAEGNIIWQKQTDEGLFTNFTFEQVFSDDDTEQAVVFGTASGGLGVKRGLLSKYSKNGDLVWRRFLESSRDSGLQFDNVSLDADPSFYYLLFCDQVTSGMNPTKYTFGKVSSSGNGLGDFQYSSDGSTTIDYKVLNAPDQIGRLSDGSVSNSSSDLMSYPFTANKLLFDDLATNISNKKRQMDDADSFEYSGSPAIRVNDFQELNLLSDVYSGSGDWVDQSGKGNDGIVPGMWIKTLGSADSSYKAAIDNNYYYSAGMVQSEGQGNRDAYISKWNFNGSLAWQKIIGGTDLDQANDIVVDSNGNVYLIGNTKSIVSGQFNILIVKLDSNGSQVWQKIYGSSTTNMASTAAAIIDYSGNIIFGIRDGFGATATFYNMKIDADGNIIWQYTYSTPISVRILNSDNSFYSITSYPDDNTYGLTLVDSNGSIVSQLSFGINYPIQVFNVLRRPNGNFVFLGSELDDSVSPINRTVVLVEYDFQMNPINNKTYIETSIGFHYANRGVLDSKGNLYAIGLRQDSSAGSGTYEALAFKFNTDLEIEWAVTLGGNSNGLDLAYDIEISPDEKHIYITGFWRTNGTYRHNHFKIRTDNGISPGTYGSIIVGNHSYSGPTTNTQTFTSGNLITNTITKSASSFSSSNSSLTLANSTLSITTELDTDPIYNAAGYWEFDGVDDNIAGPPCNTILSADSSIELWVNFDDVTTRQTIISGYTSSPDRWDFEISGGSFRGGFHDNGYFTSSTAISIGDWNHVMLVLNSSTNSLRFYLNGVLDNSQSCNGFNFGGHTNDLMIGDRNNSSIGPMDGKIGQVRIYPRALTPTQVYQNYNATQEKYTDVRPNTSPRIASDDIVYGSNLLLNYDFGNNFCIEKSSNVSTDDYEFILDDATTNGAAFGDAQSVATGYGKVVVGARGENCTASGYTYTAGGKAFIYNSSTGDLEVTLVASDISGNDWNFGNSVAICNCSGKIAVSSNNALYLYDADGTNEIIINESSTLPIIPPGGNTFGNGLAISGNRVWVSDHNVPTGPDYSGTVYCFNVETGALLYELRPKNTFNNFRMYGTRIAAGGGKLAIGAESISHPVTGRSAAGRVYLYDVDGTNEKILEPDTLTTSSLFGVDGIAIDHGMIVVGASRQQRIEDPLEIGSGEVYVFDMKGDLDFSIRPSDDPANEDIDGFGFGSSVAVSSDRIIVGARYYAGNAGGVAGRAYQFTHKGKELQSWIGDGGGDASSFGSSMDAVGGTLVIGAGSGSPDNSGRAYVYPLTGTPSGKVLNLSSSSYTGTINGAEFDTDGYFDFDGPPGLGAGDYINIGTTSTFNWIHDRTESGWAIEGWYLNDRDEEYGALISNNAGTSGVGFYMGQRNDSQFECVINKGTTGTQACRLLSTNVLDHDTWYHIVFVNDNYTVKLYVNGVLQSNAGDQNSFATGSSADASTDLRIAKLADSPTWNLDGEIGEVRIYQTSLSATEVSQNFNATKSKYGL